MLVSVASNRICVLDTSQHPDREDHPQMLKVCLGVMHFVQGQGLQCRGRLMHFHPIPPPRKSASGSIWLRADFVNPVFLNVRRVNLGSAHSEMLSMTIG